VQKQTPFRDCRISVYNMKGRGGFVSLCLLLRGFLLYLPDRTRSFGSLPSYIVAEMVVVVQGKANNMHPTPRRTRPPTFT
jgi:hypothetical protein